MVIINTMKIGKTSNMNRIYLLLVGLLTCLYVGAEDKLTLSTAGNSISIGLDNETSFTAFQMDVIIPQGLTKTAVTPASRIASSLFEVDSEMIESNVLRVIAHNTDNQAIDGNTGELVNIALASTLKTTDKVEVKNIRFVKTNNLSEMLLADVGIANEEPVTPEEPDDVNIDDTDISGIANTIYFDNAESVAGGELTLSVKMKNSIEPTGFQFDLYLPEGVSVVQDADGFCDVVLSTERTTTSRTNTFDSAIQRDGSLRVLAASTKNYAFSGNDGEVCTIKLKIDGELEPGNYPLVLKNIELTNNAGGTWNVDYLKRTLTIVDYVLGDANGDTRVSVGDFSAIASHIMGVTPEGFVAKAADVNTDNRVSVGDLSAVVSMIMNGGAASAKARNANFIAQENSICANAITATPGVETDLIINLSNTTAVTAMQFDVCLPDGMTIVEDATSLSSVRASHTNTFDYGMMEDNNFRVLAASTTNALIDGNDGEIVRIRVRIDESMADGEYPIIIRNAEVADNVGRSFLCDETVSLISVKGSTTGIGELNSNTSTVYYDLNGIKKNKMHDGINIIRSADGTMRKVMK